MPVAKRARVSSGQSKFFTVLKLFLCMQYSIDDTLTPSQVVNTEEGKIYGTNTQSEG